MKRLIMNRGERFDLNSTRSDIDGIVNNFDRYLDECPAKTAKSMHALLGPIPMILDGARLRKENEEALVGRAVRALEMNQYAKGFLSKDALASLEQGTQRLLALFRSVPVTALGKLADRIRYGLYYSRRKKAIEWLEKTRAAFVSFLCERYSDETKLRHAWSEPTVTFDTVRFPSAQNDAYRKANATKKADIDEFRKSLRNEPTPLEEEDENE